MSSTPRESNSLKVLFATPECAPLVKTGGLGDVSGALPAALREEGVDCRVLLPGYPPVLDAHREAPEIARFVALGHPVRLLEARLPAGVPLIVVDCPALFDRGGGPYQADDGDDWEDNAMRFGVLSRVAAVLGSGANPLEWKPDVVHCNDWQTALTPTYLSFSPDDRAATLLTVHNLAFQGIFEGQEIRGLQLPDPALSLGGVEYYGRASFLKGGLVYADAVTTVSPTYAREIQGERLGFGLDGVLRTRTETLFGVLNGIDTAVWNPQTDPLIPSRYGPLTLEKKLANKLALKQRLAMGKGSELPLLGVVSRITEQKGIDLLVAAIDRLVALPAQVAILGTGDRELVEKLRAAHARHPEDVGLFIGFDEGLAHLVEAGADIFLMPSRFEPCGMNQMYSQRYGTPPVVTATGGLVDTVVDEAWQPEGAEPGQKPTGFMMRETSSDALVETTRRAVQAFHDAKHWRSLQLTGMARDFGWGASARRYIEIYRRIRSTS